MMNRRHRCKPVTLTAGSGQSQLRIKPVGIPESGGQKRWPVTINLGLSLICLLILACASQSSPTRSEDPAIGRIYKISEHQALDLVRAAMQEALPDTKIYKTKDPRHGFYAIEEIEQGDKRFARFQAKTYIHFVHVRPAHGRDDKGAAVSGYYLRVSGSGDLESGPSRSARLKNRLEEVFEKTGRAVAVTEAAAGDFRDPAEQRQTDVRIEDEKAPSDDVFEKLKKLKQLRDQEVVTEEEFQNKKRELLDRI